MKKVIFTVLGISLLTSVALAEEGAVDEEVDAPEATETTQLDEIIKKIDFIGKKVRTLESKTERPFKAIVTISGQNNYNYQRVYTSPYIDKGNKNKGSEPVRYYFDLEGTTFDTLFEAGARFPTKNANFTYDINVAAQSTRLESYQGEPEDVTSKLTNVIRLWGVTGYVNYNFNNYVGLSAGARIFGAAISHGVAVAAGINGALNLQLSDAIGVRIGANVGHIYKTESLIDSNTAIPRGVTLERNSFVTGVEVGTRFSF
ncbi:MAG: hypothetical protein E7K04_02925 [Helicobacter sp.]|nr:hypothetical protein [Helicobacter sp.]